MRKSAIIILGACLFLEISAAPPQSVPSHPAKDFEFIVIGDTRPRFESKNFRTFETLIPKINARKPALVINLGDMIYGYGILGKEKQWDKYQQVVKAIHAPYYQIPGNHDAYSKEAREVYSRRFGKSYNSFDIGDSHFILLDNTEEGRWGYVGPAQFEWLKDDLKRTKARSVFAFLHFPVWEQERIAPKYHEFWRDTLHPLFKESRVRAVFGGHFHCYGPTREFDGIAYFITGGGGAELRPEYKKSGGEFHFLSVKVSGDAFDLRVVTETGESTDAEADVMGGLLFADKNSSWIGIENKAINLRTGVKFFVTLTNPYSEFLSGKADWIFDPSVFSIEPLKISVRIPKGGTHVYAFNIKNLKEKAPLPWLPRLEFNLVSGGHRHRFQREVLFLQTVKTPFRTAPPVFDGRIEPWADVPPVRLGENPKTTAELRTCHDGETLYLAVTVPLKKASDAEEPAFRDDLQIGIADRLSETDFGSDFIRLGMTCDGHAVRIKDRTPGRQFDSPLSGIIGVCNDNGKQKTYEIAIPAKLLKPLQEGKESRLILNLSFSVFEGESGEIESSEPSVNSFSYQIRYGSGDSLVPVHFIELILERKK